MLWKMPQFLDGLFYPVEQVVAVGLPICRDSSRGRPKRGRDTSRYPVAAILDISLQDGLLVVTETSADETMMGRWLTAAT